MDNEHLEPYLSIFTFGCCFFCTLNCFWIANYYKRLLSSGNLHIATFKVRMAYWFLDVHNLELCRRQQKVYKCFFFLFLSSFRYKTHFYNISYSIDGLKFIETSISTHFFLRSILFVCSAVSAERGRGDNVKTNEKQIVVKHNIHKRYLTLCNEINGT